MTAMSPLIRSARTLSIEDVSCALADIRDVLRGRAGLDQMVEGALDNLEQLAEQRRTAPPPPGVERDPPELVAAIERLRAHWKAGTP